MMGFDCRDWFVLNVLLSKLSPPLQCLEALFLSHKIPKAVSFLVRQSSNPALFLSDFAVAGDGLFLRPMLQVKKRSLSLVMVGMGSGCDSQRYTAGSCQGS